LSSWKYSFELVLRELDLAKKRKKALDDLYNAGKISQSTYEHIERELTEVMIDLEAHLGSLAEKMKARAKDLENQIRVLEVFLANLEIHYAAGEIDEETYANQSRAIVLGLDATKKELENIKTSLSKIPTEAAKEEEKPEEAAPQAPPSEAPVEKAPEAAESQAAPPTEAPTEPVEEAAPTTTTPTEETKVTEEKTEDTPQTQTETSWGSI